MGSVAVGSAAAGSFAVGWAAAGSVAVGSAAVDLATVGLVAAGWKTAIGSGAVACRIRGYGGGGVADRVVYRLQTTRRMSRQPL